MIPLLIVMSAPLVLRNLTPRVERPGGVFLRHFIFEVDFLPSYFFSMAA